MNAVWKFPISIFNQDFHIRMPVGATILSVQVQRGVPCLWALVQNVDTSHYLTNNRFFIALGTGTSYRHNPYGELKFIGTFQLFNGDDVYHLFETGA